MGFSDAAGIGTRVGKGRPLAMMHARSPEQVQRATQALRAATSLSDQPLAPPPVIHEILMTA